MTGEIYLEFKIGKQAFRENFFVAKNLNKTCILGSGFLAKHSARIYYDLLQLRINNEYFKLENSYEVFSLVRCDEEVYIPPHTSAICKAKIKHSMNSGVLSVSPATRGYVFNNPDLMLEECIVSPKRLRVPVLISNNSNRGFKLRKGGVLGSAREVAEVSSVIEEGTSLAGPGILTQPIFDLSTVDVEPRYSSMILPLLKKNSSLFVAHDRDLTTTTTVEMYIDTGNHPPVAKRPYRESPMNQKVIHAAVDEMLDAGIIEPSDSPFCFPVVIVDKKSGEKRFCIDFRKLNEITTPIHFPLPLIDDILSKLHGKTIFTSLDCKSGYFQVPITKADRHKTSFSCSKGQYEFKVMPFGLRNAPSVFQRLMQKVVEGLSFVHVYLDDIVIASSNAQEHLNHLLQVFERLKNHNLKLKLKKCTFMKSQIEYLGFTISDKGIGPIPSKVESIKNMDTPKCKREVRAFVGLASFYRRFNPNFSHQAAPLLDLTKKYSRFHWDEKTQKAFDDLKENIARIPFLVYPDFSKPFLLYTDSSGYCIGAVLAQATDEEVAPGIPCEKPVHFLSHRLSDTQIRWSTTEKEAYALFFALQKLDGYLRDSKFTVFTDHASLKYMLSSPFNNPKVQRWATMISGYDLDIVYLPGPQNSLADLLSRPGKLVSPQVEEGHIEVEVDDKAYNPVQVSPSTKKCSSIPVNTINSNEFFPGTFANFRPKYLDDLEKPTPPTEFDLVAEQIKDPDLVKIKKQIAAGVSKPTLINRYMIIDDILHFISNPDDDPRIRIYVPSHLKSWVLQSYHTDMGHFGVDRTYANISECYYWPCLFKDVYDFVQKCVPCQQRLGGNPKAPIQETALPPYPWAHIYVDTAIYDTSISGNSYVIGFTCGYTGWLEAFPVADKSADTVVELLIEQVFPRHGCPLQVSTDNGTEFVNNKLTKLLTYLNIDHVRTSTYHPQANAPIERAWRTLNDILAKLCIKDPNTWDVYLNQALAAIRFSQHSTNKHSPFELLYGRQVVLPLHNLLRPRRKYLGENFSDILLERQHKIFKQVHQRVKRMQRKNIRNQEATMTENAFAVGDLVFYKSHKKTHKLDTRWSPGYVIIKQTTPVNFTIKDQLTGKTVKTHANSLKRAHVDDWEIEIDQQQTNIRPTRKATLAYESMSSNSETEIELIHPELRDQNRLRVEREDSLEEDRIPLAELQKRLRANQTPRGDSNNSSEDIPLIELQARLREGDSGGIEPMIASEPEIMEEQQMVSRVRPLCSGKSKSCKTKKGKTKVLHGRKSKAKAEKTKLMQSVLQIIAKM